ncbi:MAG: lysophospholipid acyltransferase family protein [Alphaproteobacteria bacterium]|nr:lysophospholipid acyltransferase family protein [Rhodospirillales bacterium]MCW9045737.1 lysophospholipid acyltransferase family protein [Alphaproteobacteria bacterium]
MAIRSETYLFWQKYLGHPLQAILLWLVVGAVRLVSVDTASKFGGWFGRTLGPKLKVHKRAINNLTTVFPEKSPEEIATILDDMWDNLGRTTFEFPHMGTLDTVNDSERFTFVGAELIEQQNKLDKPAIYWGGHLGNWEILPMSIAQHDTPMTAVVRMPDNPWVTKIFYKRSGQSNIDVHPKGRLGAKASMETLRNKGVVGFMVDQKMNDGIAVPFFGRDAMTAPAPAQLALKYDCDFFPCQLIRQGRSAKFKIIINPSMEVKKTGDRQQDARVLMSEVNAILEQWIRQNPGQWLWPHKRWPD